VHACHPTNSSKFQSLVAPAVRFWRGWSFNFPLLATTSYIEIIQEHYIWDRALLKIQPNFSTVVLCTVDSLVTHGSDNPYSLKSHTFSVHQVGSRGKALHDPYNCNNSWPSFPPLSHSLERNITNSAGYSPLHIFMKIEMFQKKQSRNMCLSQIKLITMIRANFLFHLSFDYASPSL
jgi:hypothetical protein